MQRESNRKKDKEEDSDDEETDEESCCDKASLAKLFQKEICDYTSEEFDDSPDDIDFLEGFSGAKEGQFRPNIDFSRPCPYCKQIICDGTTISTFCYSRIAVKDDDRIDAEIRFKKLYLFLKEYEKFQSTRYTNPDVEHGDSMIPQCVMNTFKEYIETGKSTFNEQRLSKIASDKK